MLVYNQGGKITNRHFWRKRGIYRPKGREPWNNPHTGNGRPTEENNQRERGGAFSPLSTRRRDWEDRLPPDLGERLSSLRGGGARILPSPCLPPPTHTTSPI